MSDLEFDQHEFTSLLDDLCNGTIDAGQHQALQAILASSHAARQEYLDYMDLHVDLKRVHTQAGDLLPTLRVPETVNHRSTVWSHRMLFGSMLSLAACVMIAAGAFWLTIGSDRHRSEVARTQSSSPAESKATIPVGIPEVLLTQSASARFLQESMPLRGEPVQLNHEYVLSDGTIELKFPSGATAIVDAPAIFEVASGDQLLLTFGNCSVHAPDGAEGFRVETPRAEVIDLGTRFVVSVGQVGETAVQVVEGEANVYPKADTFEVETNDANAVHLVKDQSSYVGFQADQSVLTEEMGAATYRRSLPDRVIAFEATRNTHGAVDLLESITVQRGDQEFKYDVDQLVGIDLIHYRASSDAVMTSAVESPDLSKPVRGDRRRTDLLDRDRSLCSGLINPGGSSVPLTTDPILNTEGSAHDDNTPGLGIRFKTPLVNSAGPDLVLFELQTIVNPESGDPFHVSPLRFRDGLHSFTVRKYDIDLLSPESKELAPFRLYRSRSVPTSLPQLLGVECFDNRIHAVRSKVLVVGIDLSDLGFAIGETTDGLFFQDALDDKHFFDPTFIAGLPPLP